jgi:hypothetical protein
MLQAEVILARTLSEGMIGPGIIIVTNVSEKVATIAATSEEKTGKSKN